MINKSNKVFSIDKFKNHVSIDNFFQDCSNFKVDKQTYDISYPEFLKYFSDIKTITKHNLVIGINFTFLFICFLLYLLF